MEMLADINKSNVVRILFLSCLHSELLQENANSVQLMIALPF